MKYIIFILFALYLTGCERLADGILIHSTWQDVPTQTIQRGE